MSQKRLLYNGFYKLTTDSNRICKKKKKHFACGSKCFVMFWLFVLWNLTNKTIIVYICVILVSFKGMRCMFTCNFWKLNGSILGNGTYQPLARTLTVTTVSMTGQWTDEYFDVWDCGNTEPNLKRLQQLLALPDLN